MREEKYDISGMHCAACSASVEKVTRRLPGVERSDVNLTTGILTICYDEAQTGPEQMWRGVFEALALSYQRVWAEMTGAGAAPERVIASGRVTTDHPTWLQLLCDALDTPVIPLEMKRATLRGTTLIALEIIDPGGTRATPPLGEPLEPRYAEHYVAARRTFDELYATLIGADSTS